MELDFEFGKPAKARNRRREYALLGLILTASCLPYVALYRFDSAIAVSVVLFTAGFKVLATFMKSMTTDTAHHIRFLLAGSNPIGMTGGSSMMLGAVDSVLDWREDKAARRRHPMRFAIVTLVKLVLTPIGLLLMVLEFSWDLLLLGLGFRMVKHKWNEFFSLAHYHDTICPEKSNDIFYADMAYARYRDDPYHYQWVRMRSMVFELQHYKIDVQDEIGDPQSNLFLMDEISAYNILKRLRIEEIESALDAHYGAQPNNFLFPPKLSRRLIENARPIQHYIRIRKDLDCVLKSRRSDTDAALESIVEQINRRIQHAAPTRNAKLGEITTWHLLRLLDSPMTGPSFYLRAELLTALIESNILRQSDSTHAVLQFETPFDEQLRQLVYNSSAMTRP